MDDAQSLEILALRHEDEAVRFRMFPDLHIWPPTRAQAQYSRWLPGSFHFTAEINAATAKVKLIELAEEIIAPLCADPNAIVRVTVEISAEFPYGAPERVRRSVSENANNLYRTNGEWE